MADQVEKKKSPLSHNGGNPAIGFLLRCLSGAASLMDGQTGVFQKRAWRVCCATGQSLTPHARFSEPPLRSSLPNYVLLGVLVFLPSLGPCPTGELDLTSMLNADKHAPTALATAGRLPSGPPWGDCDAIK